MKICLIEHYNSDWKFDNNSFIVALNPEVCYHLDKAKIKYHIIEEFYSEVELLSNGDEYYETQCQWINGLDEFLQDNIQELKVSNLRLASIYYYYLKTFLLDPLYFHSYLVRRLFEKVKPSEVLFVSYSPGDEDLKSNLEDISQSYYMRIIKLFCREQNIRLTLDFVSEKHKSDTRAKPIVARGGLTSRLKEMLAKNEIIRDSYYSMLFIYKCLGRRLFLSLGNKNKLGIFILRGGYSIWPDLAIDALKRGHSIYELQGDFVVRRSLFGAKRCFFYQQNGISLDDIWEYTAKALGRGDLIKRINAQCQLDVSEIVLPRLQYFISCICPQILNYIKAYKQFYSIKNIDFILAPFAHSIVDCAALAAAKSKDVNTVCLDHGDDVFANKAWRLVVLQNFNVVISSNREAKEYFEYLGREYNIAGGIHISPHRLLSVKRIGQLRQTGEGTVKKGRIIYVPIPLLGERRRIEGHYPETYYYIFQKSLIEYFSTRTEYTFVWKGLPQSDHIYNPIPEFTRDNGFTNIEFAANPFVEHLLSADKVIFDFPSTGFYEAIVAGVPAMSLYQPAFWVRKSALDVFGNLLKSFSDIPEALNHIDEFLSGDPELYKTTIDMGDEQVIDILENIGKGNL